ncbi:MAG: SCO family protein, partial [Bacteriovoracaceae bacterium]|nr:SCO family protein [Bacteriovoracaceae bacterium]
MWKIILNIFALIVLGLGVVYKMNYQEKDQVYSARSMGIEGGDFTLSSDKGDISLSDYKGQTVILYFGFTTCPDVCPMSLSYVNNALRDIPNREDVKVLFISVDHQRDDASSVGMYARYFHKDFIGLAGTKDQIDSVT